MIRKATEYVLPWLYLLLVTISVVISTILYIRWRDQSDQIRSLVAQNQQRILENRNIIKSVQSSRVRSCKKTYISFLEVFKPFFPKHRATWTLKQKKDWARLVRTVRDLEKRCAVQTTPRHTSAKHTPTSAVH